LNSKRTCGVNMPDNLYTAQQVRELDRIAIEDHNIDGFELMQKAARFAFRTLVKQWPECKQIYVLCGSGNNAGDGYILAGIAKKHGFKVKLDYVFPPEKLKGDALLAYQYSVEQGVACQAFTESSDAILSLDHGFVIIDALLGTGLNSEVTGLYHQAISLCNQSSNPTLAIDIPSGLSANTGQALGIAIEAYSTASFIGLKQGMYTGSGRHYCGEIFFGALDVSPDAFKAVPISAKKLNLLTLIQNLKPRKADTHKGQCGHVLLIGGDHGYGGAIILAAESAARTGAGLVTVATRTEHLAPLLSRQAEIMAKAVSNTGQLVPLLANADVIVIGPGLGQSAWSQQMLLFALKSDKPTVIDADALNLISQNPDWLKHKQHILTPHPGEAARLLNISTLKVQEDRFKAVQALQHKWGGSTLLKGSGSLIAHERDLVKLCPYGNPGMATGGMGDVLSGILGALLAQGLSKEYALELGTCLHACAADIAAEQCGQRGLLASDLTPNLRLLMNGKTIFSSPQ